MPVGLPLKTTYANGDVYSASDVNDTNGTVNLLNPTAKGSIVSASAANTPARLTVGADGSTLVANSASATGLAYALSPGFAAGKNKIINGDCAINQRNFISSTTSGVYLVDRFKGVHDSGSGTVTYSVQQFTPGTAPVTGYEAKQYKRIVTTNQTLATTYAIITQNVEDVRTFAGTTATISFWAKAASGTPKVAIEIEQAFGSGGSPSGGVRTYLGQVTLSTSWARYTVSATIPSVSGKTIGTDVNSTFISFNFWVSAGSTYNSNTGSIGIQSNTFDFWGIQIEAGSVATPFQTATGTLQGELAACQRYYVRFNSGNAFGNVANAGYIATATAANAFVQFPVTMRIIPTTIDFSGLQFLDVASASTTATSPSFAAAGINLANVSFVTSGAVAGRFAWLRDSTGTGAGFLGFSAEV